MAPTDHELVTDHSRCQDFWPECKNGDAMSGITPEAAKVIADVRARDAEDQALAKHVITRMGGTYQAPGPVDEGNFDVWPLTCQWCRQRPATRLLVLDYRTGDEHRYMTCRPCATDTVQARAIAASSAPVWLFALTPLPREDLGPKKR